MVLDDTVYAIADDWFEVGTRRLDDALRPNHLVCCVTCLYSDYSPGGHGLMGMRCHRRRSQTAPGLSEVMDCYL
jgi:hypothetical protein